MSQSIFITVLAVLTAIVGTVLVMMMLRRRREAGEKGSRAMFDELSSDPASNDDMLLDNPYAGLGSEPPSEARERRRTIDDYAIPVGFDTVSGPDDEIDVGKICPSCGARYASHHRFCQQCNDSELAALN